MKPGALWPVAIVGVLAITVGANAYLVFQARDPSVYVVEPDYYRKAVQWDSTLAQRDRDAALGWRLDAALAPYARGLSVVVTLADSAGAPLTGARVQLEAISNVDAARRVEVALVESRPGTYRLDGALPHDGLWELRFDVGRGGQRFTADLRRELEVSRR